jgi:TonB-dependent starch-binding outer membrane protein SusC
MEQNNKNFKFNTGLMLRKMAFFLLFIAQLLFLSSPSFAQTKTIKGKVIDDKGAVIEGASVTLKGSTVGTTTDKTGHFSLAITGNPIIVISYVSFEPKEIAVTNSLQDISVTLMPISKDLAKKR